MTEKTAQQVITLTGVLVPDNWQESGEVSGLALLTNDESKYILHYSDSENELMPMLREKITISGLLSPEMDNNIIVTSFSLLSAIKT